MALVSNCTTLRNISGSTMFFDFIGEHGRTMTSNEDVNFPGDIWSYWRNDAQKTASLMYAVNNNLIEVIATPAVIGFDTSLSATRRLVFASGDVSSGNPAYGSYSGSTPS